MAGRIFSAINNVKSIFVHVTEIKYGSCTKCMQVATYMKLKPPPNYDGVEFPRDREKEGRLKFIEKVPNPPRHTQSWTAQHKDLRFIRGPEDVHNKLQYGQYGVQAVTGGYVTAKQMDNWRLFVNKKMTNQMFAIWRIDAPWKPVTSKGTSKRMGGGKLKKIDQFVTPVKGERIVIEIGGLVELEQVYEILNHVAHQTPFKSRIVSLDLLKKEEEREKYLEEANINPFSFKKCAKKNYLGINTNLSPFDYIWHGKHR